MPSFFSTITAVERLAAHSSLLESEFARALGEDLEYARFGALLPELPFFGLRTVAGPKFLNALSPNSLISNRFRFFHDWQGLLQTPRLTHLFQEKAPVGFALKSAELVANGALVGVQAGHAFLAGYVTQLCVRRALRDTVAQLAKQYQKSHEFIEWKQGLLLMNELHGSPLLGSQAIRAKMQVRKASSLKGVGRGFYELIRVAALENFGEYPSKIEIDNWMRGASMFALALGTPLGKTQSIAADGSDDIYFRNGSIDVFQRVEEGLKLSREVLLLLGSMLRKNSFTVGYKRRLFELLPEGKSEFSAAYFANQELNSDEIA